MVDVACPSAALALWQHSVRAGSVPDQMVVSSRPAEGEGLALSEAALEPGQPEPDPGSPAWAQLLAACMAPRKPPVGAALGQARQASRASAMPVPSSSAGKVARATWATSDLVESSQRSIPTYTSFVWFGKARTANRTRV